MNALRFIPAAALTVFITTLSGCFEGELFPDKTVIFEGRIVEAFNSNKPIDSVLVQGCTQPFSLFPTYPSCDVETFTDEDGYFFISLEANDWTGKKISYAKDGYQSIDSCIVMADGRMECYLSPLPTFFHIYSPVKNEPFTYDSLIVHVSAEHKDTTVVYVTGSYINTSGGTSYYWTNKTELTDTRQSSYTNIRVNDNSTVRIEARYFQQAELATVDFDTLFCEKGIGSKYLILD